MKTVLLTDYKLYFGDFYIIIHLYGTIGHLTYNKKFYICKYTKFVNKEI